MPPPSRTVHQSCAPHKCASRSKWQRKRFQRDGFGLPLSQPANTLIDAHKEDGIFAAEAALSRIVELDESSNPGVIYSWKRLRAANQRYRRHEQLFYWLSIFMLRRGDMIALPLPSNLMWMYPLMRPFSKLARAVTRSNEVPRHSH